MSEQDNIKAARATFDAWNAGDLSLIDRYRAEGFITDQPGAPGPMNGQQHRMFLQNFLTAFPGSKFEVWLTIAQGDYVVVNWRIGGVHTGPLQTPSGGIVPPTGKTIALIGSDTAQVKNGKVTHIWGHWDLASLLGQLGLLPPM